jgi:hypothetical protein
MTTLPMARLDRATKLRLRALSSFGAAPTVRRIALYDMERTAQCLGANAGAKTDHRTPAAAALAMAGLAFGALPAAWCV